MKSAQNSFRAEPTTTKPKTYPNEIPSRRSNPLSKEHDKQHEQNNQETPIRRYKKKKHQKNIKTENLRPPFKNSEQKHRKKRNKKEKLDKKTIKNPKHSKYLPMNNELILSDSDDPLSPIIIQSQVDFMEGVEDKLTGNEIYMKAYLADIFDSEVKHIPNISQFFTSEETLSNTQKNSTVNTDESSCCCFTKPNNQQTECCASNHCFGIHYELNCCDENNGFTCNSISYFSPCIDAETESSSYLANINAEGICCDNMSDACTTLTSCLPNLEQVIDCVPQTATQCVNVVAFLGSGIECLFELANCSQ